MATVAETLELANKCDRATGPDRELDGLIFRAIGAPVPFQFANQMVALIFDEAEQCYFAPVGDMRVRYEPPAYTALIDAAMSLIPEGLILRRYIVTKYVPHSCEVAISYGHGGWVGNSDHSMALALCAAALRAAVAKARES